MGAIVRFRLLLAPEFQRVSTLGATARFRLSSKPEVPTCKYLGAIVHFRLLLSAPQFQRVKAWVRLSIVLHYFFTLVSFSFILALAAVSVKHEA